MQVRFRRIKPNAVTPTYASQGDACMDMTAISKEVVDGGDHGYVSYDTGLAFEIPEGYVGLIYPRSSVSKTGMILANSVGVIDSSYRGSVSFRYKAIPNTKHYDVGEKVGQLMIIPIPKIELIEVSELSDTDRGTGSYGSTGS